MRIKIGYVIIISGLTAFSTYHFAPKKEVIDFKQASFQKHLLTQEEQGFRDYFANHGSPYPAAMAKSVSKTKRPHLTAAIAVRESRGNPKAKGDSGRSKGAWQVQERHWGKVSPSPIEQALQHERILEDLEREVGLPKAIERYNGKGKEARKYKKETVKEAVRVAMEVK